MLKELLQKISDWTLEKEEEMAKNCQMPLDVIDKQIKTLQDKKDELVKTEKSIDNLIERLEKIKNIEVLKCEVKK